MKKVGILGGTFAPIHKGHINIARQALIQAGLNEVWFVVAGVPPHKETDSFSNRFQRYEMCRIALKDEKDLLLCDFELFDIDKSYTAESLLKLNQNFPSHKFYFIMGEDSLDLFDSWKGPDIISKQADILVAARSGCDYTNINERINELNNRYEGEFKLIETKLIDISSSRLREAASLGELKSLSEFLPDGVYDYIKEHRVFAEQTLYDTDMLCEKIHAVLDEKRFNHSLRVADTAAALANTWQYPEKIAYLAGLLHDCGKFMNNEDSIRFCDEHDIKISDAKRAAPQVLHGLIGAYIAENEYGIKDKEVLSAITYHTTGRADMSLLEKIIFVADYMEPGRRRSKMLDTIRPMAYKDIDTAIIMILKETFEFLAEKGSVVDDEAKKALKYYTDIRR